jgi:BMFP domain-containing protein YqiC
MAAAARDENDALRARIEKLEAALSGKTGAKAKPTTARAPKGAAS